MADLRDIGPDLSGQDSNPLINAAIDQVNKNTAAVQVAQQVANTAQQTAETAQQTADAKISEVVAGNGINVTSEGKQRIVEVTNPVPSGGTDQTVLHGDLTWRIPQSVGAPVNPPDVGSGLRWRGAWDAAESYFPNDVARFEGIPYVASALIYPTVSLGPLEIIDVLNDGMLIISDRQSLSIAQLPSGMLTANRSSSWSSFPAGRTHSLSQDIGLTWSQSADPLSRFMTGLISLPNGNILAAETTHTPIFGDNDSFFIRRSIDGGISFDNSDFSLSYSGFFSRLIRLLNGNILCVFSTRAGSRDPLVFRILRSTDNGSTFTPIGEGLGNFTGIAQLPNGNLIGTVEQSVLRSTDGGVNWSAFSSLSFGNSFRDITAIDNDTLVAIINNYAAYSFNGGLSWTTQNISNIHSWRSVLRLQDGTIIFVSDNRHIARQETEVLSSIEPPNCPYWEPMVIL